MPGFITCNEIVVVISFGGRRIVLFVTCFPSVCLSRRTSAPWTGRKKNKSLVYSFFFKLFYNFSLMSLFLRTGPAAARRLSRRTASEKCFGSCFEANFLHHRCSSAVLSLKSDRQIRTRSCLWSRSRSYSSFSKTRPIRIGCASGFWGDTATSGAHTRHCFISVTQGNVFSFLKLFLFDVTLLCTHGLDLMVQPSSCDTWSIKLRSVILLKAKNTLGYAKPI